MSVTDTPVDIVRNFVAALESNSLKEASGFLSDTFIFKGWTPQELDKKGFLSLVTGLKDGIPGLIFTLHNMAEQDATVTGTMQITGYQTDSFLIPAQGTPVIPQTANSVTMPTEEVTFTLNAGQISSMSMHKVEA
ncbi:MAG: hypothetical protein NVSMB44_07550 [Ktedonobacteraceae bacterium]